MSQFNARSIPRFDRVFSPGQGKIARIGDGEIGGKTTGLLKVQQDVLNRLDERGHSEFFVSVPSFVVLCTDLFDEFMADNGLYDVVAEEERDDVIAHTFQRASLPTLHLGDLRALAESMKSPLAVRSSSLLEDALDHPFAGVYATKMIPNNQPAADIRFQRLIEAIKFVYASTFFRQAQSYLRTVGKDYRDEKMAVIIQEVVGQRCDDRFYPGLSGVARSYNYYPTGGAKPQDGVVNLALGLGRQIVDGGLSWTYCPAYPKAPSPFNNVGDLLKNTQTGFWAVNMGPPPPPDPIDETEYMVHLGLKEAEYDGTLDTLASTYDPASDRMRPGCVGAGPRVINFSPILEYNVLELNGLITELLRHAQDASGMPVEIEFAMTTNHDSGEPRGFGFLQMRPMMVSDDDITIDEADLSGEGLLLASENALGNGQRDDIRDIVYLKPDVFDPKHTRTMASELDQINRTLERDGLPYLLIGFGRWGSSDPWLGVPVEWSSISGARVIVESSLPNMNPDLSQGSHFFHNMISFKIMYISTALSSDHPIDWDWLAKQTVVSETEFARHVRVDDPLRIKVDGLHNQGMVRYD